jgi:hypothetical protein
VLSNSRAAFTAETTAGGSWDTATVALSNEASGVAFSAGGLVPGDTVTGEVTVTYDGSADSVDVELHGEGLAGDAELADHLHLTITDGEGGTYEGTLSHFEEVGGVLPWTIVSSNEDDTERTYAIEVTFSTDADEDLNHLMTRTASVDFVWEATSNPTHGQD